MKRWLADTLRDIADRLAPDYPPETVITWPDDVRWIDSPPPPGEPMSGSFVIHTEDGGRTWEADETPR